MDELNIYFQKLSRGSIGQTVKDCPAQGLEFSTKTPSSVSQSCLSTVSSYFLSFHILILLSVTSAQHESPEVLPTQNSAFIFIKLLENRIHLSVVQGLSWLKY